MEYVESISKSISKQSYEAKEIYVEAAAMEVRVMINEETRRKLRE